MFKLLDQIREIIVSKKNKRIRGNKKVIGSSHKSFAVKTKELEKTIKNRPIKLRFSPVAWAKFLFMRDVGDTEVGGFAITLPNDLLYINDFILPKQKCTMASVSFEDESVANFVDDMVDKGFKLEQFLRIWIHTHPNMSASPSHKDESTFSDVFGKCDWAVMAIISSNGAQYCRLQVNGGPFPGSFEIPIEIDYKSYNFPASDSKGWRKEYEDNVDKTVYSYAGYFGGGRGYPSGYAKGHAGERGHVAGFMFDDDDGWWDEYPEAPQQGEHVRSGCHTSTEKSRKKSKLIIPGECSRSNSGLVSVKTSIPDELLQHLTPNEMSVLETLEPYEREYFINDLKKRLKIGD